MKRKWCGQVLACGIPLRADSRITVQLMFALLPAAGPLPVKDGIRERKRWS